MKTKAYKINRTCNNILSLFLIIISLAFIAYFYSHVSLLRLESTALSSTTFTLRLCITLLAFGGTALALLSSYSLNIGYKSVMFMVIFPSLAYLFFSSWCVFYYVLQPEKYMSAFSIALDPGMYKNDSVRTAILSYSPNATIYVALDKAKGDMEEVIRETKWYILFCEFSILFIILMLCAARTLEINVPVVEEPPSSVTKNGLNTSSLRATRLVKASV